MISVFKIFDAEATEAEILREEISQIASMLHSFREKIDQKAA